MSYILKLMLAFLRNIGPTELIVLFAIIVFLFGSKIAMRLGKASGETLKEMKKLKNEVIGGEEQSKAKPNTKEG